MRPLPSQRRPRPAGVGALRSAANMSESNSNLGTDAAAAVLPQRPQTRRRVIAFIVIVLLVAVMTATVTALLVNVFERKQEAKNPYLKLIEVTEETTDPAVWGTN